MQLIQLVEQGRNMSDHLENSEGKGRRGEGKGQTLERTGEEQDRGSPVIGRMTEEGRGRTNPESMGDEPERNVRGEGKIEKSKTGSRIKKSGRAASEIIRKEQPGEERS